MQFNKNKSSQTGEKINSARLPCLYNQTFTDLCSFTGAMKDIICPQFINLTDVKNKIKPMK